MATYELCEWVTRPFSRDYSIIVAGDFSNLQPISHDTKDLLCFDANANTVVIFATVRDGALNDGTIVQNGPWRVSSKIISDHDLEIIADHYWSHGVTGPFNWTHIVAGPFGRSGFESQVLFYDAHTGVGSFFDVQPSGGLELIRTTTGWRTSWTHITAFHTGYHYDREDDIFKRLLFYDAVAGVGELYDVEHGRINLIASYTGWRSSWHTIIPVGRGDGFDDLLFYDKGAGTGQFNRIDIEGQISELQTYTSWRQSWRQIRAGDFGFGGGGGLLFHEEGSGFTEIYGTDGSGGMHRLDYLFDAEWQARAANFDTILPGNFVGERGHPSDLCGYDPSTGVISYFRNVSEKPKRKAAW